MKQKIAFAGAGAIGTALGNLLAGQGRDRVVLYTIEKSVAEDIISSGINSKYFPTLRLNPGLTASNDPGVLSEAGILFLALPSSVIIDFLYEIKDKINTQTILVNLAKGFGSGHKTITSSLRQYFPNPVTTLKGPSFARDIVNNVPTAFTLGGTDPEINETLSAIFEGTTIYLDYTEDIEGVEILSILKNIYSIVMGIVDAQYDSPNIRFLILTKAFREMHKMLIRFGGKEETLFKYCGFGDFTLTSLNDLSRNRTLGLLIGKGFFTENISHDLVLEGRVAVSVFYEEISKSSDFSAEFPIINELFRIFTQPYEVSGFVKRLLSF